MLVISIGQMLPNTYNIFAYKFPGVGTFNTGFLKHVFAHFIQYHHQ